MLQILFTHKVRQAKKMTKTKTATLFECIKQIQKRDGGFKETPRKSQGYSQLHRVVGTCATPGVGVGQSTDKISTAVEPTDDELNAAKQASLVTGGFSS